VYHPAEAHARPLPLSKRENEGLGSICRFGRLSLGAAFCSFFVTRILLPYQLPADDLYIRLMSPHPAKASLTPDHRIRFTEYQGKQIITVDVSHCSAETVAEVVRKVPDVVSTQPLRSVLIFVDFTGAEFNAETLRALKETAVFDKPYVKKSAWIGVEDISPEFKRDMSSYALRDFPSFRRLEDAMEWLVKP